MTQLSIVERVQERNDYDMSDVKVLQDMMKESRGNGDSGINKSKWED